MDQNTTLKVATPSPCCKELIHYKHFKPDRHLLLC